MELLRELWSFFRARQKFWLAPVFIIVGLFGGLLLVTQGTAVAPFIYTLF